MRELDGRCGSAYRARLLKELERGDADTVHRCSYGYMMESHIEAYRQTDMPQYSELVMHNSNIACVSLELDL